VTDWLTRLLRPELRADADPNDEGAWTSAISGGGAAASGVWVSADTALQSSPVWACVRLLSESIASLPIHIYRRLADGGKERAPEHPLYELLHDAPNDLQTAFDWKRVTMVHALLWGAGYSQIRPGPRGAVDRLEAQHPDLVREERLAGGGLRYMVRGEDGVERPVNAEDMLHIRGLSVDGVTGLPLIAYARESIGLGIAAREYSARFYSQNAQPGGVLKHPGKLTPEAAKRMRESWQAAHAGLYQAHRVAVLEEGTEWMQTGMTHADAELIAQLDWSAADVARFFNVPLHMIQQMTKTTSWGSGIEEMSIEYVTYSLLPWVRNWEGRIGKDLIIAKRAYFAEFLLEGLLRGKLGDRYTSYATGRQWGWLSVNDVRRLENMNPIGNGDDYLQPLNMVPVGSEPVPAPARDGRPADAHYDLLLRESAARVVRKELAAMGRAAKRYEGDNGAWRQAVNEFYSTHGAFVAETLRVEPGAAEAYARAQADVLLAGGPAAMDDWETRCVDELVGLTHREVEG